MTLRAATPGEVQDAVRSVERLLPRGGGSKSALSSPGAAEEVLELSSLRGVCEYLPGEFTITARAGTPVAEVEATLAENGQYLPFDPLLVESGATLGGTVAAGASGPGRLRYGGVRDFLLGVQLVDGRGTLLRGGGRVVKNAAGFDIAKLMVGSLGRLGILVELTLKVFPQPDSRGSVRVELGSLQQAVVALCRLTREPMDLDALDLEPPTTLWVRLAGSRDALQRRSDRLRELLGGGEPVEGDQEAAYWRARRELAWVPPGGSLVKVPVTPKRIVALEERLAGSGARRIYSGGGQQLWLAWPAEPVLLEEVLVPLGLCGLVLLGSPGNPLLGDRRDRVLLRRVREVLDPDDRFPQYPQGWISPPVRAVQES